MKSYKLKYLNKDRQPPGTIRKFDSSTDIEISIITYDKDFANKSKIRVNEIKDIDIKDGVHTWIHCPSTIDSNMLIEIGKRFEVHPLILENIQNIEHRPKLNDTEKFNFIIQKSLVINEDKLIKNHIGYIIFKNTLITFSNDNPFIDIEDRLLNGIGKIRVYGTDYLLFCLMDLLTDEYFTLLDIIEQKTIVFEEALLNDKYKLNINEFLKLKNQIDLVQRYISPLTNIIEGILTSQSPALKVTNLIYFKDLLNNTIQIIDLIQATSISIDNILNLSINISGYKMNGIMKVLTIISTIFIPLTFIAGIYGMNFVNMPELESRWGYPIVILLMVIIALFMINFFRRKRWL